MDFCEQITGYAARYLLYINYTWFMIENNLSLFSQILWPFQEPLL